MMLKLEWHQVAGHFLTQRFSGDPLGRGLDYLNHRSRSLRLYISIPPY